MNVRVETNCLPFCIEINQINFEKNLFDSGELETSYQL